MEHSQLYYSKEIVVRIQQEPGVFYLEQYLIQ